MEKKLRIILTVLALAFSFGLQQEAAAQPRYQVGVCDWMILKRQKLGEFQLAKDLGCDGLEMDMGGLGKRMAFDNKMRDPKMVETFKQKAAELDIKIGGHVGILRTGLLHETQLEMADTRLPQHARRDGG